MLCFLQNFFMSCNPEGFPRASTKITALVLEEILFNRSSGNILKVSKLTSTNTGFAPRSSTTFAVAG